ncbi:hypothetical protein APHAL10511_000851 [Amanita phalloides]|nr:hypothetical protein APHAL10511_000851 [Amanita phalloides]
MGFCEFRRSASKFIGTKSLYARITLTPFTFIYFLLIFLTCIIMAALQAVAFANNTLAINTISPIIGKANVTNGLAINANGILQYCDRIPLMNAAQCNPIVMISAINATRARKGISGFTLTWRRDLQQGRGNKPSQARRRSLAYQRWKRNRTYMRRNAKKLRRRSGTDQAPLPMKSPAEPMNPLNPPQQYNVTCAKALLWVEGMLNDERREDFTMLAFQFWLFFLSAVAILSQSLPHLGAALAGHILSTGWAGNRIRMAYSTMDVYQRQVIPACGGQNPLGTWWQTKNAHTVPIAVVNGIILAFMLFLSYKIYRVYSTQTFNSVGATPTVERILKIVLLFSLALHLATFFVIALAALWINKATNGSIGFLATNETGFIVAAVIMIIVTIPWMFVGWIAVRKECQWRFLSFCLLSVLLSIIFTTMFWSGSYRFIFTSWPFFTTVCALAYALVGLSTLLAIWCRFNFGQGCAHFIEVSQVLENMDFPQVYFSKEGGAETGMRTASGQQLHIPPVPPGRQNSGLRTARFMRASVYSNNNLATIKLSSSQPLYSDMINTKASSPTSPTFHKRSSVLTVTQRLRRVFEYRRSNASSTSHASGSGHEPPPVVPTPLVQPPPPAPPSPKAVLTSQITQLPKPRSERPPPLLLSQDDNTIRGRSYTDKDKRRSRSVSLGRLSGRSKDRMMDTIAETLSLGLPARPKSGKRPLPIRPLPRTPATAPLDVTLGDSDSDSDFRSGSGGPGAGASLVRRGGLREPPSKGSHSRLETQW